jgi:hypothetical protein
METRRAVKSMGLSWIKKFLTSLQNLYYTRTVMPTKPPIVVSAASEGKYNTPWDKKLAGHRLTIEGFYFARPKERDAEGGYGRIKKSYHEEFVLDPSESYLDQNAALGAVLSGGLLTLHLRSKDPDFQAVNTHVIAKHENLWR